MDHGPDLEIGGLVVDPEQHRVVVDGEIVKLTPREFALLALLVRHVGKVLTHKTLLREVWVRHHLEDTHSVRIWFANSGRSWETIRSIPALSPTSPESVTGCLAA